ncbi:MFS transporter [Agromyces archimandritae]|uniref:MFS transporter n=1 Tax=Agromyces archimandritae TaxID=2781962 RepID=A0A975FKD7_9MICO|nr:MFS transporter [Agromyces archimandritae]QTX04143.1 MFS transporter [Agromyces archimandritae]
MTSTRKPAAARTLPAALRRPAFRRLTAAWVFTNLGDSILFLTMAAWVKDLTGSDALAVGVLVTFGLAAFLAPVLGQIADRVRRAPLLAWANFALVPVVAALLFVDADRVWIVHVVCFVYGAIGYLTGAAQSGVIRDLLPDEELAGGNGLLATIDQAARLVAPLAGAALYSAFGAHLVIVVTGLCFLVSGVLLTRLRIVESEPESAEDRGSYLRELGAGFRAIGRTPGLLPTVVMLAVVIASTGLGNVAVFPALELGFGLPAAWIGVIVTVQGVGSLFAGATAARVIGRLGERRTLLISVWLMAVGALSLLGSHVAVLIAGCVLIGFAVTWMMVAATTLRQRLVPSRLQGRVSAAFGIATAAPQSIAMVLGAGVLAAVDYRWLIVVNVAMLAVIALAGMAGRRRVGSSA